MSRWAKGCCLGCGVTVLLVCIAGMWLYQALFGPPPAAPRVASNAALRPTFILRDGRMLDAGTAVVVKLRPGAAPIMITAGHLLGTAGGLERNLAPGEIDRTVRAVLLTPLSAAKPEASARGSLRKSGQALSEDNENPALDLAAFRLAPGGKVHALPLAPGNPRMGEWLWMAGDEIDHEPQAQRLFAARVMVSDGVARSHRPVRLQGFSGAPLINARGEVAGLLIGGTENGMIATFNPAGAIRERLAQEGIR